MLKLFSFLGNRRISITTKFTLLFVVVGIVPLSVSGIISYSIYQKDIREMTIESAVGSVEIIRTNLENILGGAESFLRIDETQWPILFFEAAEDKYDFAIEIMNVYDYYRKSYDNNPLIKNIYIIGLNGRCLSESQGIYFNHKSFITSSRYFSEVLANGSEITIIPEHIPNYDKLPSDEIVVSMGTVLYNNKNFEPVGIVLLDLDPAEIKKIYTDFRFIGAGTTSLKYSNLSPDNLPQEVVDEWADIEAKLDVESRHSILSVNHNPYLFVTSSTKYWNLEVIGTVPVNELFSGVYAVRNYTLVGILVSAALVILIYLIISRGLMRPIEAIQTGMQKAAEGDLDIDISTLEGNMISDLYISFKKMQHDLKQYLQAIDDEHKKYLDAELRVLQEQINPHFLYNTLDTILWSAVAEGNDEIVELVSEMSKFFRLSLSKRADYVRVCDEIECITSYLHIQQMRYGEMLNYTIEADEDVLEKQILKLVLQPLVENALYHGIKTKRGGGTIKVNIHLGENRIYFSVKDDGFGMNEERLKELHLYLEDPARHMGIENIGVGLLNVQNRIMIKYAGSARLTVESVENEGTEVSFSLPLD